ncbi:MAG: nitroreductase family protein [Nanoarchaeota archaeon]|nr:nitroreductase family protein [Nanoarchaeota archaeon]MBU4352702.1 nitroreductase family protein [Nanoarchaeota archaeon]
MEVSEAFKQRRSIRKYSDKKVPMHLIHEILDESKLAPSAGNTQNWRFIVVTDVAKQKEIAKVSLNQNWMTTAPIYLVVCNESPRLENLYGKSGKFFSIQNCAAITSFILLSATEKGLGSCWVGVFDYKKLQDILELPDDVFPDAVITLGYSDESKSSKHQRNDIENITFFNIWKNKTYVEEKVKLKDRLKKVIKK